MIDVISVCSKAKEASYSLCGYTSEEKNSILLKIADMLSIDKVKADLLTENRKDIEFSLSQGKDQTFIDRLTLNDARIKTMTEGLRQIAALPDPVGEVVDEWSRESGIYLKKVRAPLGVIGIIYEARPNVTVDAAVLCLKSGNGVVLRGGKEAINSNRALYLVMKNAIDELGFDSNVIGFIDDISREASKEMLLQDKYIDVIIPRGGEGLKHFVLENAKMPVIASAGGNCHTYVEKTADLEKAVKIIVNAKCQRPSTCNALEHVLIDEEIAEKFIPVIFRALKDAKDVEIVGDLKSVNIEKGIIPASEEDFATEFLGYKISFMVVNGVREAVSVINKYSTKHSEAILTNDKFSEEYFVKYVDAAACYVNTSTRFTDGFEFGLGAEMGISTQKLHARGPIALKELTSVKYVITSDGSCRK
ncbi:MAG: glutamate-5-semialdehyde dehydrogenase [Clostridia bacterium]|nr:glutamate-5-semialdehyde dehydrogenase [Clostridia bacterium]